MTVSDLKCDRQVQISNQLGDTATPVADILAFPDCPGSSFACLEDPQSICLDGGRFRAEMNWTDFAGNTRGAEQAELTRAGLAKSRESGVFTFFGNENWELLVKVLDGCGFNDHFWVFATATTNVEYELQVTDTTTGQVWRSQNPLGRVAPAVTDTNAFAGCFE